MSQELHNTCDIKYLEEAMHMGLKDTASYCLVSINGETPKFQYDLTYKLKNDEYYEWDELIYSFYDGEPELKTPMVTDKVKVFRKNVQPAFVDTMHMVSFIVDTVEVVSIISKMDEPQQIELKLTSKKRSK